MIVIQRTFQSRFQFVQSVRRLHNQFTVLSGLNRTSSLKFLELTRKKSQRLTILLMHQTVRSQIVPSAFLIVLADEIANLKLEADALKEIKLTMGTKDFATKVFEKVFNTDIQRLLSMSDMWKSRTPPRPLKYSEYTLPSIEKMEKIAQDDQKVWDLNENIAVFKHRYSPPERC